MDSYIVSFVSSREKDFFKFYIFPRIRRKRIIRTLFDCYFFFYFSKSNGKTLSSRDIDSCIFLSRRFLSFRKNFFLSYIYIFFLRIQRIIRRLG